MGEYENPTYKGGGQEWMAFQQGFQSSFDSWFGKMAAYGDKLQKKKEKYQTGVDATQDRMMGAVDNITNFSQEGGDNAREAVAKITRMLRDGDYTRDQQIQIASDFVHSINTKGKVLQAKIDFNEDNYSTSSTDNLGLDLVRNIGDGVNSFWDVTKGKNGRIVIKSGLKEITKTEGADEVNYYYDNELDVMMTNADIHAKKFKVDKANFKKITNNNYGLMNKEVAKKFDGFIVGKNTTTEDISKVFNDEEDTNMFTRYTDEIINEMGEGSMVYLWNDELNGGDSRDNTNNLINQSDFLSAGGSLDDINPALKEKFEQDGGVFIPYINGNDEATFINIDGKDGITDEEKEWNKEIAKIQQARINNFVHKNVKANHVPKTPRPMVVRNTTVTDPIYGQIDDSTNILTSKVWNIRNNINTDAALNKLNPTGNNTIKEIYRNFDKNNSVLLSMGGGAIPHQSGGEVRAAATDIQVERPFNHKSLGEFTGYDIRDAVDHYILTDEPHLLDLPPTSLSVSTKNAGGEVTGTKIIPNPEYKLALDKLNAKRLAISNNITVGKGSGNIRIKYQRGGKWDYEVTNINYNSGIERLVTMIEKGRQATKYDPYVATTVQGSALRVIVDKTIANDLGTFKTENNITGNLSAAEIKTFATKIQANITDAAEARGDNTFIQEFEGETALNMIITKINALQKKK